MHLLSLLACVASASAAAIPNALLSERQTCSYASASDLTAAKNAFQAAKLVPDLIPSFNPTLKVSVSYPSQQVNFGNTFNTIQTIPEPTVSFTAEPGYDPAKTKFTIIFLDPDAPGPALPILRNFLHQIISDAQPQCINTQTRKQVAMHMFPTPLSVSPHRYSFLVYRQPPNYTPPPSLNYLPGNRARFDLAAYVKQAGLQGPVGGNYYREGLAQDVCLVTPGCTQDGIGYVAPTN